MSSHPNWPHRLSQDGVLARSPPHHRPIDPSLARSWNECQLKRRGTTHSTLTESTRRTDGGLWPLWSRALIDGRWLLRRIFEEHHRRRYLTWDDSFHSFFHWKERWIVLIVHFGQRPEKKWNLFNDISEILVSSESSSVVEKSGNGSSVCLLSTTMWKFARCRSKIIVSWNDEVFFSKPRNRSQRSPKKNSCQHIFDQRFRHTTRSPSATTFTKCDRRRRRKKVNNDSWADSLAVPKVARCREAYHVNGLIVCLSELCCALKAGWS